MASGRVYAALFQMLTKRYTAIIQAEARIFTLNGDVTTISEL